MDKIDNPSSITIKSIPLLLNKSGFKFPSSLIRRILVEFSLKVKIYRSCGGIGHAGSGLVPRFPDPSSRLPLPPCPSLRMHRRACTRLLNARSIFSCRAIRDASAVFATPSPLYSIPLLSCIFPLCYRYHSSPAECSHGSLRRWSGTRKKIFKRFPFTDSVIGFVGALVRTSKVQREELAVSATFVSSYH